MYMLNTTYIVQALASEYSSCCMGDLQAFIDTIFGACDSPDSSKSESDD